MPSPSFPSGLTAATVTRVVDGDTVVVNIGGQEYKLRYIGVDTPETVDPRRPVGCFGHEASTRNRELVEGRTVGLEKDVSETDDFGRLLRYVWLDPSTASGQAEMVNARLVEEGYAQASTYPPDVKYAALFARLQSEARDARRGLWGPACQATLTPSAAPGACEYSSTSQPVIKGNISAGGEKIYHVPGGAFYDQTVIDEAKGERWFCTEADALAAGWRRSKS
jgi:micrococcal nuclease